MGAADFLVPNRNKNKYDFIMDNMIIGESITDGAKTKIWVTDVYGNSYLYKESKKFDDYSYTYEHISEYLAKSIADMINIPCVDITLGNYSILSKVMHKGKIESFVEVSEELAHSFHMSNLTTFDISTLLDRDKNPFCEEIVLMLLFDALIGNSDRHPGNFACTDNHEFYPLFDNGSSLCAYIREEEIENFFRDKHRFISMCTTKSKPVLRDDQKLTHEQLVNILRYSFNSEFNIFKRNLFNLDILNCILTLPISDKRKSLIQQFLEYRLKWFM